MVFGLREGVVTKCLQAAGVEMLCVCRLIPIWGILAAMLHCYGARQSFPLPYGTHSYNLCGTVSGNIALLCAVYSYICERKLESVAPGDGERE